MVKFVSNFCYCAVDQQMAVFQRKRAVSGPFALWTPLRVPTAGSPHHSGVSPPHRGLGFRVPPATAATAGSPHHIFPPQRGLPTTAGSPHHSGRPKWSNLSPASTASGRHAGAAGHPGSPHHSGVSPPQRGLPTTAGSAAETIKFVPNFRPRKSRFSKETGCFWLICPFGPLGPHQGLPTIAGSGSPHHSGVSPPQRGLPTTAGSPPGDA